MSEVRPVVRSFIDLRSFAAAADREQAGESYLDARVSLPLADGPVGVDLLMLTGNGAVSDLPADEFVLVLRGALRIEQGGAAIDVATGASVLLPGGLDFAWTAQDGAQAIVMRCSSGPAGTTSPVLIDETAALVPSGAPLAELLVGETPSCRTFTDYRSANGEFMVGTWDSTPYFRMPMLYRHYELMHLLEGAVEFVDGAGSIGRFSAGDVFLVEMGAECSWDSKVHVKKVYAIYRPA